MLLTTSVGPHALDIVQNRRRENAFFSKCPESSAICCINEWPGMMECPVVVFDSQEIQKLGGLVRHKWLKEDTSNPETLACREYNPVDQGLRVLLLDYDPGFRVGDEGIGLR